MNSVPARAAGRQTRQTAMHMRAHRQHGDDGIGTPGGFADRGGGFDAAARRRLEQRRRQSKPRT